MWTAEKINEFMKGFGFKPSMTKAEIKELPYILHPDEHLLGLLEGMLNKINGNIINGHGIAILTDKRIIFYRKTFIGTVTKEEIPIPKVSSVSFRRGVFYGAIAITTSNNEAIVDHCEKTITENFVSIVQNLISGLSEHKTNNNNSQDKSVNRLGDLDLLEKLFDLKQKGIITEEEFLLQKSKLLQP